MRHHSILLAEDNTDLRDLYAHLLRSDGFEVMAVEDGEAALDALSKEKPDAIVTDINMPHMDGLELIEWIRSQENLASVPIIAMTAYTESMMLRAELAGATKVIQKPIDRQLCFEIKDLLSSSAVAF